MRNIFFIGISLFVIMLSSCRSHRQVVQQTTSDSTIVTFREVEKIVHLEGDTVAASMQANVSPGSGEKEISFTPQTQIIETKRTSVKIELTKSGEIKATAISKELDEKVTVLEKTISKSKSTITEYQVKENPGKHFFASVWKWVKGILFFIAVVAAFAWIYKFGNPVSIIFKNLLKK